MDTNCSLNIKKAIPTLYKKQCLNESFKALSHEKIFFLDNANSLCFHNFANMCAHTPNVFNESIQF